MVVWCWYSSHLLSWLGSDKVAECCRFLCMGRQHIAARSEAGQCACEGRSWLKEVLSTYPHAQRPSENGCWHRQLQFPHCWL